MFLLMKITGVRGLGKWLVETILAHPDLQGLRRILLATKDAHKLYEQCGFTSINNPERYMVYNPTVHKKQIELFSQQIFKMLQVAFIRQNTELVKERLAIRNFKEIDLVDTVIALDDERKKLQFNLDETQSKINIASKQIGQLIASGEKMSAEEKKMEVAALKSSLHTLMKSFLLLKNNCRITW